MLAPLRRFFAEDRPENVPERVWRDWVIVAVFAILLVIELSVRDMAWRPAFLIVWTPLPLCLLWRRTHPLAMLTVHMGVLAVFDIALAIGGHDLPDVWSGAFALALVYAPFRWGSGREALWAVLVLVVVVLLDWALGFTTLGDTIGGFVVLFATAELGVVIRRQRGVLDAGRSDARARERDRLARELHDTVAHHVSAIAIQAQAGRAVIDADPAAAASAFAAIEESASRALVEMRVVVDALRADTPYAPPQGVRDVAALASDTGPTLQVDLTGDLDDLPPQLDAALYRLAQESITNARRHAPTAGELRVAVHGGRDEVRLVVTNDGAPVSFRPDDVDGHGLVGMEERVALLGGSFEAGPRQGGGWQTAASIPRPGRLRQRLGSRTTA